MGDAQSLIQVNPADVSQCRDETVFIERFPERRNIRRDVIPEEVVAVTRDEHERQATTRGLHPFAQFQSVQTREPDVQDHAIEVVSVAGKLFGGREKPNLMAHRAKKPAQSGAHIDVVIDDGEGHGAVESTIDRAPRSLSRIKLWRGCRFEEEERFVTFQLVRLAEKEVVEERFELEGQG